LTPDISRDDARPASLRQTATAKVNLTLTVLGRREDFYHELQSLVAFASPGDRLELEPGEDLALVVEGPFAAGLEGRNLVIEAARAAKAAVPTLRLGRFRLTKNLPVAAGLGGGSADAAAALRLLAQANEDLLDAETIAALAAKLGSDVTACLASRAALMTGRGEIARHLLRFPPCGVVLANAGQMLATAEVYTALRAPPLSASPSAPDVPDFAGSFDKLIDYASTRVNDLEPAALSLAPAIEETLSALGELDGAVLVRLSGSGPTCFALVASKERAERQAAKLTAAHPTWWVASGALQ
jgi:4-diphosphocytidyl-2-C-methyl-D-erythritol kinase